MALNMSSKRMQIDKANFTIVVIVAAAAFVTMFSLVASKALWDLYGYQGRVIEKKQLAKDQLAKNVVEANKLLASYQTFVDQPVNVIGGSRVGDGDRDGDNGKIILDALPSKYDYPALAVSMDKLFSDNGFNATGLSGSDDELAQSEVQPSASPTLVEIPFQTSVPVTFDQIGNLFGVLERSIRPMQLNSVSISGADSALTVALNGKTYYLPPKTFEISKEVIK